MKPASAAILDVDRESRRALEFDELLARVASFARTALGVRRITSSLATDERQHSVLEGRKIAGGRSVEDLGIGDSEGAFPFLVSDHRSQKLPGSGRTQPFLGVQGHEADD